MINLRSKMVSTAAFSKRKYPIAIAVFANACFFCIVFSDFILKYLVAHPIEDFRIFIVVVFTSVFISWDIHEIKIKQEMYKNMLPLYASKAEKDAANAIKKTEAETDTENIMDALDKYDRRRSWLFLFNLFIGAYIAFCVSSALLAK